MSEYSENCCWNGTRDLCLGRGCTCACHVVPSDPQLDAHVLRIRLLEANANLKLERERTERGKETIKRLARALEFAVKNLEEVALPNLDRGGIVSSVPEAISRGRQALRDAKLEDV